MKATYYIFLILWLGLLVPLFSQTVLVREKSKWGVKENDKLIINPIYDTIFGFDSTEKVCLACFRTKTASNNKFIKVFTTTYSCNYLNKKNQCLVVRNQANDTCSVFLYTKASVKQYKNNSPYFVVSAKGKRHLLYKNFQQITFKGYYDINLSPVPNFYYTHYMNEGDILLAGLINEREEEVIPHQYSTIKINTKDSLIVGCSASVRNNAEDDVFDYKGKKVISTLRHIDMATKNFLIHKIFEPREYYILYNIQTREEKTLNAEEVKLYEKDEILIHQKDEWFIYDLATNQKKPFKPS